MNKRRKIRTWLTASWMSSEMSHHPTTHLEKSSAWTAIPWGSKWSVIIMRIYLVTMRAKIVTVIKIFSPISRSRVPLILDPHLNKLPVMWNTILVFIVAPMQPFQQRSICRTTHPTFSQASTMTRLCRVRQSHNICQIRFCLRLHPTMSLSFHKVSIAARRETSLRIFTMT